MDRPALGLLRLLGCHRLDSTIFSLFGGSSAAAIFWFVIPETYTFGSVTILLALCVVARARCGRRLPGGSVAVSTLTLSFTVTNWMVGLLAAFLRFPWRKALQISIYAFCLMTMLWGVQKVLFPSAVFPLGDAEERSYIVRPSPSRLAQATASIICTTMVMPAVRPVIDFSTPGFYQLLTQRSWPGSGSVWGIPAVLIWLALLGCGAWATWHLPQHRPFTRVLLLALAGQLVLHLVYGEETFLYALHFLPLLLVLAAMGTFTRARPIVLSLAGILLLLLLLNNMQVFDHVTQRFVPGWLQELNPRGKGHILIGEVNALDALKTVVEPEGIFSPGFGSYGVYCWGFDPVSRRFYAPTIANVPHTRGLGPGGALTPWTEWQAGGCSVRTELCAVAYPSPAGPVPIAAQRIRVRNTWSTTCSLALYLAIRPLGPAGWPIRTLEVSSAGDALLADGHPALIAAPTPSRAGVYDGDTIGGLAYFGRMPEERSVVSKDSACSGAVCYDLTLAPDEERTITLICPVQPGRRVAAHAWDWSLPFREDAASPHPEIGGVLVPDLGLAYYRGLSVETIFEQAASSWHALSGNARFSLPDARWSESLPAIANHVAMTMNADAPDVAVINYNTYTRDAVYMIDALLKVGAMSLSQRAIDYLLACPFNGRAYPEADNPGEVLWIMGSMAVHARQTLAAGALSRHTYVDRVARYPAAAARRVGEHERTGLWRQCAGDGAPVVDAGKVRRQPPRVYRSLRHRRVARRVDDGHGVGAERRCRDVDAMGRGAHAAVRRTIRTGAGAGIWELLRALALPALSA